MPQKYQAGPCNFYIAMCTMLQHRNVVQKHTNSILLTKIQKVYLTKSSLTCGWCPKGWGAALEQAPSLWLAPRKERRSCSLSKRGSCTPKRTSCWFSKKLRLPPERVCCRRSSKTCKIILKCRQVIFFCK